MSKDMQRLASKMVQDLPATATKIFNLFQVLTEEQALEMVKGAEIINGVEKIKGLTATQVLEAIQSFTETQVLEELQSLTETQVLEAIQALKDSKLCKKKNASTY